MTTVIFGDEEKSNVKAHAMCTMIGRNGVARDFAGVSIYLAGDASKAVTVR